MRIGFFTDSYKPYMSGVVKSIDLFTAELLKLGHDVYIFAPNYPDAERKKNVYRFKSVPAPTNPGFRLAIPISNRVVQEVKELRLDIIHTHSPFLMGWLGRYVARKLDLPLVFTYHTLYEEYAHYAPVGKELARRLAIKYSRDYCQSCDLVIAPTKFVEKVLKDYQITTRLKTVATGIDLTPYRENDASWVREKYQIHDKEKVLLFVGRLGQEKNVTFLLKAFRKVLDSITNVRLLLVGDGPERGRLERMVEQISLNDKVIFAGRQEPVKVVDYYLASDLFVFPSITETQGLVTLEAMAGGLPVVAVNAAGSTVMVDDGFNGLLVKADQYLFAEAVIELLTHETRYNLFRKNALKKAEQLSIENMTAELLAGYREIISARESHQQHLA
ncbi:MAG: 1,2-diacylglycerol 3-alpha-glucosyltransferase [Halanaerobiales bacterium]|nr:1,2-diacylglycerol 3-alpha-glucosyltransferase [Halanaerobiales bacterium]